MRGLGIDAGDHFHSWMTTQELLEHTEDGAGNGGLMEACRNPLLLIQSMNHHPMNLNMQTHDEPGAGELRSRASGMLQ
eukprot:11097480-Heterocapsa_arctica.AAC.1